MKIAHARKTCLCSFIVHYNHYNQILTGVLGGPTDVLGGPCPCCLGCSGVVETIPVKQKNTQYNDFKHWSG